jgi:probable HAF family extracellular repeat protein
VYSASRGMTGKPMTRTKGAKQGGQRGGFALAAAVIVVASGVVGLGCSDEHAPAAPASLAGTMSLDGVACGAGLVAPVGHAAIVELASFGGDEVFVQDVSNDGVVVGSQRAADGRFHAFRYTDEGGLQDLGLGGPAYASAIGADGSIVGQADRGDGVVVGYRYTAAGGRVQLCETECSVWDVNGHEQAVGLMLDPKNALAWQAFIHDPRAGQEPHAEVRLLGTLGGARSSASGINDLGVVVGNAQLADSAQNDIGHAFTWDMSNGMRDLNARAGASGAGWVLKTASDVSATAVTGYGTFQGHTRPFVFDLTTSTVHGLGLPADAPNAYGWALDAQGDVVGWSARDDRLNEAFVYSANFGLRRLTDLVDPALAWDLQQATGLNDRGVIVGWGYHAGLARGFKLTLPLCHTAAGG